jgi:hypothetical protein
MLDVVGPDGVAGSALEADEETVTGLDAPMSPGERYWVTSPHGDLFLVEAAEGERCPEVRVRLDSLATTAANAVDYATVVAARLQALLKGPVHDRVVDRPLDPRAPEHVAIEASEEPDGFWVRTRGLEKYGRPELEVYGVAADERDAAMHAMRRVSSHLTSGGTIEPGRTLGLGSVRLVAREGERNREHWGDTVVLELVDLDPAGHSRETGTGFGHRGWVE